MKFMLVCYFDASYDSPATVTIVSGWVASTVAWQRFDADWRILLAQYDVPYFHMREFAHSVGPFAGWKNSENKRANFLKKAVDIIRCCALHGFACLVGHAPFIRVDKEFCLSEAVGSPFALAGRDCVAHVNRWLRKEQRGLDVDYVFEAGDAGAAELARVMRKDQQSRPIFAPSKDALDGAVGVFPLQAADFAAYELLKAYRLGEDLPLHRYRRSIQELAKIPPWWGRYSESDLTALCERVPIRPRSLVVAESVPQRSRSQGRP